MPELSILLSAASLGGMIFFSAVTAPTVFQALSEAEGGKFLRAVFPKYFLIHGLLALLAAALTMSFTIGPILAVAGAIMLAVRFFMIPLINDARDAMLDGNEEGARTFAFWHRSAVIANVINMLLLLAAVYLLISTF